MIDRRAFIASGLAGFATLPALAQGAGWMTLFDGKTLEGWTQVGDPNISLMDGVVQADKGNGHLVSKNEYSDFELRTEIWIDAKANSGIFVRFPDKTKPSSKDGYEFNVFDARPDPSYGTGAIVDTAKAATVMKAANKWTSMEIIAKGAELSFKLDGVTTIDKAPSNGNGHLNSSKGFISLQFGGGLVRFRKVEIREL